MKQIIQLGTLSAVNIGINFLFQWYLLTQLGPGVETDALFAGMTLPQLALAVISGSLTQVLVPLLAGEEENRSRHDAWGFLALVGMFFGMLAVTLYITAPWWIPITVPGFNDTGKSLTTDLTRIQLIGMVFAAVNGVQSAAYFARQKFVRAELASICSSTLGFLLLVWTLPKYGIAGAAWVGTLRLGLQTFLLAPGMGMPDWSDFKRSTVRKAWGRMKPLLIGTTFYKTEPMIDRFLLSSAASGSLSLYYLAQQIYSAISQVLNKAIATPLMPVLSNLHKSKNEVEFRRIYIRKLWMVIGICSTSLIVLGVSGQNLLHVLIGHGNVTAENTMQLWWLMLLLGGVFVGGAAGQICAGAFYAKGSTTIPMVISAVTYALYIPTKVIIYQKFGIWGLSFLMSIYYMTDLFLLFLYEKKTYNTLPA